MINRKRLGDILIQSESITEEQLETALNHQKEHGGRIGNLLIEHGFLTEDDILRVLSDQFKIEIVNIEDLKIDSKLLNLFNESFIKTNLFLPFEIKGDFLCVLISDPTNILIKDEIKKTVGLESKFYLTNEREIERKIDDFYLTSKVTDNISFTDEVKNTEEDLDFADENSSLVIEIVNDILKEAINEGASDIHFGVVSEKVLIRLRIDGVLIKYKEYPLQLYKNLVSRIKTISQLNITNTRSFQNGRITRNIGDKTVDMRVSTLPTIYGEKIVIRLLDKANLFPSVDYLGFNDKAKEVYSKLIKYPYGMILITGPTGSGKSSTLYTTINELFDISKNIITIEDPVEYKLNGIEQVQVNEKAEITFASGLKSILRQDPDIIMVGEIRDKETAQIATGAALTGHLVFSTLHTNDTVSSISRLADMGVESYLVASTVMGVVNQRLVRKLCSHCKEKESFDGNIIDKMFLGLSENDTEQFDVFKAVGCKRCKDTGYSGRIALHEILVLDDTIRRMIAEGESDVSIREVALKDNLLTLKEDALIKIKEGLTSISEIRKYVI